MFRARLVSILSAKPKTRSPTLPNEFPARRCLAMAMTHDERDSNPPATEDVETTHLIASGSEGYGSEAGTAEAGVGWDGLADFEGLPWWRRPSVRLELFFVTHCWISDLTIVE